MPQMTLFSTCVLALYLHGSYVNEVSQHVIHLQLQHKSSAQQALKISYILVVCAPPVGVRILVIACYYTGITAPEDMMQKYY